MKRKTLASARSCFTVLPNELSAFSHVLKVIHSLGQQWSFRYTLAINYTIST